MKEDERKLASGILHCKTVMAARGVAHELGIHTKRLNYILNKWSTKGWWEYGTAPVSGWITETGRKVLSELTKESGTSRV